MLSFFLLESYTYVRYDGLNLYGLYYVSPPTGPYAQVACFFETEVIDHPGSDIMGFRAKGLIVSPGAIEVVEMYT